MEPSTARVEPRGVGPWHHLLVLAKGLHHGTLDGPWCPQRIVEASVEEPFEGLGFGALKLPSTEPSTGRGGLHGQLRGSWSLALSGNLGSSQGLPGRTP